MVKDMASSIHPITNQAVHLLSKGGADEQYFYRTESLLALRTTAENFCFSGLSAAREGVSKLALWIGYLSIDLQSPKCAAMVFRCVLEPLCQAVGPKFPELMAAFNNTNERLRQQVMEANEAMLRPGASIASGGLPLDDVC